MREIKGRNYGGRELKRWRNGFLPQRAQRTQRRDYSRLRDKISQVQIYHDVLRGESSTKETPARMMLKRDDTFILYPAADDEFFIFPHTFAEFVYGFVVFHYTRETEFESGCVDAFIGG